MRYGKIYFFDRMGNKEGQKDSKPRRQGSKTQKPKDEGIEVLVEEEDKKPVKEGVGLLDIDMNQLQDTSTSDIMQISEDDMLEEDLCNTCRKREIAFLKAKVDQDEIRVRERIEEDAMLRYMKQKEQAAAERDKTLAERSRRLNAEIAAYNQHLIEEKRRMNAELKFIDAPGYLLRNRPDTGVNKQVKQQKIMAELQRQIEEKREMENKSRSYDQLESTKHLQAIQDNLEYQRQKEKLQEYRKKFEYRQALEEQIAAKRQIPDIRGEPWWAKSDQIEVTNEGNEDVDQIGRITRQRMALDNLEQYLAKQSTQPQSEYDNVVTVNRGNRSVRRVNSAAQALVQESWRKANEDHDKQLDSLTVQYSGGSLFDQLKQYHRCKKCQKALQ